MVKRIGFILLFLSLHCSTHITTPDPALEANQVLFTFRKALKIKDTTIVHVDIKSLIDTSVTIQWFSNAGLIEGSGKTVKYIAPDKNVLDKIGVCIQDSNHTVVEDSTLILVYKQLVILKADDMVFDTVTVISGRWRRFIDFINSKKIKAGLGLVGNSLTKGNLEYYTYLRKLVNSGSFELWNHGYNHIVGAVNEKGDVYCEFMNTPYEYQKQHLIQTQKLAKEKLNTTLHTFGAPANAVDDNTIRALDEIKELKVWFFGHSTPGKLVLPRDMEIEYPCAMPDYQKFIEYYDPEKDCLVLQIHPNLWDESLFEEFVKIIEFLLENEVTFITPFEYYRYLNPGSRESIHRTAFENRYFF